jgi:hypothetical protein
MRGWNQQSNIDSHNKEILHLECNLIML